MKEELIYGINPVIEALKKERPLNKVLLSTSQKDIVKDIISMARRNNVPVQNVKRTYLDKLVGRSNHQGVAALAAAKGYVDIDSLIDNVQHSHFFVMLDELHDPHNFGAIIRTADAAGVHGVIIPKRRSVALTGTVSKTSAGAVEHVSVARVANLAQTIDKLKQKNIWVVGADIDADVLFWDVSLDMPITLVIGGEGKGLGRLVRDKCDIIVKLPMFGNVNSLNASVAAALLMYEVVRQRAQAKDRDV